MLDRTGAPLDPADLTAMGLAATGSGTAVTGRDAQDPHLVSTLSDSDGLTVLSGWIADRDELAQRLGLQPGAPLAALARAALLRFGAETPDEMLGEWSLFHTGADGAAWLMQGATTRDWLFFAHRPGWLAFAPDAEALARLKGVDAALDPQVIGLSLASYKLRAQLGSRSIYKGIEKLHPGCSVQIAPDGAVQRHAVEMLRPEPRFTGTANEALEALEEALRRILRDRLGRTPRPVLLLSGGLDSSLLAALAAQDMGERPLALCSVAPPGSGLADEVEFARAVADRHGIELIPVSPESDADPYRPARHVIAGAECPLLNNRHCLTSRFHEVARHNGGTMLVNGTYGEMSVAARLPGPPSLRNRLGALRRWLASAWHREQADFHAKLAPHRYAELARLSRDLPQPVIAAQGPPDQIGYTPGVEKALVQTNAYYAGALRMDLPYRDLRLLRLYASLPRALAYELGPNRGPARTIGKGILPEQVRQRQRGMPADPGHFARLQAFAEPARSRIGAFRAGG
ncbi:MAG TPA: asparagine synthase-related protein, partial [Novosphingobium sp.]|nr:asparagine synthase-related protein [Novosphingobium sp.]